MAGVSGYTRDLNYSLNCRKEAYLPIARDGRLEGGERDVVKLLKKRLRIVSRQASFISIQGLDKRKSLK